MPSRPPQPDFTQKKQAVSTDSPKFTYVNWKLYDFYLLAT